jgi:hypothetical protein
VTFIQALQKQFFEGEFNPKSSVPFPNLFSSEKKSKKIPSMTPSPALSSAAKRLWKLSKGNSKLAQCMKERVEAVT